VDDITFASLLTAAGAGVAAALVTSTVELLKRVIGDALAGQGARLAFALSAGLYLLAAIATEAWPVPDELLVVFVAWLTCASAAVGIHRTVERAVG